MEQEEKVDILKIFQKNATKNQLVSLSKFFKVIQKLYNYKFDLKLFQSFLLKNEKEIILFRDYIFNLSDIERKTDMKHLFIENQYQTNHNDSFEHLSHDSNVLMYKFLLQLERGKILKDIKKKLYEKRIDQKPKPFESTDTTLKDLQEMCLQQSDLKEVKTLKEMHEIKKRIYQKKQQKHELEEIFFKETGINIQKIDLSELIKNPENELKQIIEIIDYWKELFPSESISFDKWEIEVSTWARKHLQFIYSEYFQFNCSQVLNFIEFK